MRIFGFIALASLLLCYGCARHERGSATCCVYPEASIFLHLGGGSGETVTISEMAKKVNVSRDGSSKETSISSSYKELTRILFESERWRIQASPHFHQGPWTETSRTIFRMERGSDGLSLQGAQVPPKWIAAIRAYADEVLQN